MKTGIELIAQERQEQIEKHGRTPEDDKHFNDDFQLSEAALSLLSQDHDDSTFYDRCPKGWHSGVFARMCAKSYEERLIIAGALIAAEIDRIQSTK